MVRSRKCSDLGTCVYPLMQTVQRLGISATRKLSVRTLSTNANTINPSEIALFSRLSSRWWDERGEFAMLHKMNPTRMDFIRQKVEEVQLEESNTSRMHKPIWPLRGLDVLDVGCGGGLLSEVCVG